MGTALTGLEIKDTYEGLVKTTDNGPLTGSLKVLTDGSGNDSALALSTAGASVAGSLALRSAALATAATQILVVNGDPSSTTRDILTRTPAQIRSDIGAGTGDGTVTGTGTLNFVSKFTSASAIGDSSIFDNGNVGIGTIVPLGILHLKKTSAATRLAIDGDAGQNKLISYRTAGVQRFGLYVNNTAESGANAGSNFAVRAYADAGTLLTTPLFIQRSTGNVGIGNNLTPTSTLDVTGTLAVSGNATFDTTTLVVDATNNRVGIGTAAPASILQLERSSDSGSASTFPSLQVKNTLATQGDGSSTFNFSNLNLSSGDGVVNMFLLTTYAAGTWAPSAQLSVSSNHPLVFKTNNTERMRILEGGNVGIGTSSPAAKLDVNGGNIHSFYTYAGDASNYNFRVGNDLEPAQYGYLSQLGGSTFLSNNAYYASAGQFKPTATSASFISLEGGNIVFINNTGLTVGTNYTATERARITSAGNVGIGTSSPQAKLDVTRAGKGTIAVLDSTAFAAGVGGTLDLGGNYRTAGDFQAFTRIAAEKSNASDGNFGFDLGFYVTTNGGSTLGTKVATMTSAGNVGIGTSAPATRLDVSSTGFEVAAFRSTFGQMAISFANSGTTFAQLGSGVSVTATGGAGDLGLGTAGQANASIVFATGASYLERVRITSAGVLELAQGQIKFPATQVASADPNTLDDYEEGEWTMGVSFGGASVGVTYGANTGTYTKIGRKVTCNGFLEISNKGTSTGNALLTGLPFALGATSGYYAPATLRLNSISFANQYQCFGNIGSTHIILEEITEAGGPSPLDDTNFSSPSYIMVSITYNV